MPLSIPLTRPSAWSNSGEPDGPFHILRLNFLVKERQLLDTGYGEATASIVSPVNTQVEARQKVTFEYEQVDTTSLVEEHLLSSGLTTKLSADLRLGRDKFGTAGFSSALEEQLIESLHTTRTVSSARTRKVTREEEVTVTITGGNERAVHAAPYRLHEMTVRLSHVDYLTVSYASSHAGLRIHRVKTPELPDGEVLHRNWTPYGLLLGAYRFWVREGDAGRNLVSVSEHEASHINPAHVRFIPDESDDRRFYDLSPFRGTPSLYKISNAAFPLKDSQRREVWSEADVLALSEWEVDSAWSWENLRRRRRAAFKLAGPA